MHKGGDVKAQTTGLSPEFLRLTKCEPAPVGHPAGLLRRAEDAAGEKASNSVCQRQVAHPSAKL